jgi:hypothetical protein
MRSMQHELSLLKVMLLAAGLRFYPLFHIVFITNRGVPVSLLIRPDALKGLSFIFKPRPLVVTPIIKWKSGLQVKQPSQGWEIFNAWANFLPLLRIGSASGRCTWA